jgi:hypothetical protein
VRCGEWTETRIIRPTTQKRRLFTLWLPAGGDVFARADQLCAQPFPRKRPVHRARTYPTRGALQSNKWWRFAALFVESDPAVSRSIVPALLLLPRHR